MHRVLITRVNATEGREAWLDLRRRHLTATDWPQITGSSRWGSEEDVIFDKLNPVTDDNGQPTLSMQVGTGLEPFVVDSCKREHGSGEYLAQAFLSRNILGFTPDMIRITPGSDWEITEIKVSVKDWGGYVPPGYLDQVRFQATVLGVDHVRVVHLKLQSLKEGFDLIKTGRVSHNRLAIYRVDVPEAERKRIERQAIRWWKDNVEDA